jgi:hypothetical protein
MRPVEADFTAAKTKRSHGDSHMPINFSPESTMPQTMEMLESGHRTLSLDQSHRFVAGDKFFNYQQYGALRGGGEVTLFSRDYAGVLVSAAQSSFTYAIVRYCVRPALMNFLQLNRTENQAVIECLISLPTSFSLFCGLASDVLPIAGFRRKSYMVLGSTISFVMLLGLTILAGTINPTTTDSDGRGDYLIYYMLLILGAVTGTLVSKLATDARVIELSQREPLTSRGHIQINYLIFRSLFEMVGSWGTSFLVEYDMSRKNYHLRLDMLWILLVLTVAALVPIPFVLMNCVEKNIQQNEVDMMHNLMAAGMPTPAKPMTTPMMRVRAFFRMCQQRAVWQVVLFLSILLATTRFYIASSNKAFKALAHLNPDTSMRTDAIKFMVTIAVMIGWKVWWSNSDWRRTVNLGLFALVSVEIFRALMMLYVPGTRGQLFFDSMQCIMAVSDGVITIFSFIPATEIAEYGSEGATIGLLQSFRSCLAVAVRTLSEQGMSGVAAVELKQGGDSATGTLCLLLMITYGVHALSFTSVFLLPRQKLDAQQLRVYGGYSKLACGVLIAIFIAFFSFSTTINIKAIIDMAMGTSTK